MDDVLENIDTFRHSISATKLEQKYSKKYFKYIGYAVISIYSFVYRPENKVSKYNPEV